ncbi:MAG: hypothetical protein GY927_11725 [bacterium]|nr:hypothetical protein [bacterium]
MNRTLIIAGIFTAVGQRQGQEQEIEKFSKAALTGKKRGVTIEMIKAYCIETSRQHPLHSKMGITDKQIDSYCVCSAKMMVNSLSPKEVAHFFKSGEWTASTQRKSVKIRQSCMISALRK